MLTTIDPTQPAPEPMHRLLFEAPGPPRPAELPDGGPAWLVSRYDDVRQVLSDPRFGRAQLYAPDAPDAPALSGVPDLVNDPDLMFNQDGPDHLRLRRTLRRAFTPRAVARWRPWIARIVEERLDRMETLQQPADVVAEFTLPLPPDAQPLSALNVNSLILQVPKKEIALKGDPKRNPVVGVWASVSRQGANLERSLSKQAPTFRQVSRQGTPHMAFALFGSTVGLADPGGPEDRYQARAPKDDHLESDFLAATLDPVPPHRIERAQGRPAPATPRRDIQALFMKGIGKDNGATFGFDLNTHTMNADADPDRIVLAEQLRLNLTTPVTADPKSHGVLDGDLQGFPNGRRLNDNIDGPLIRMLEGEPAGPSAAELLPRPVLSLQPADAQTTFPYLNLPHAGP